MVGACDQLATDGAPLVSGVLEEARDPRWGVVGGRPGARELEAERVDTMVALLGLLAWTFERFDQGGFRRVVFGLVEGRVRFVAGEETRWERLFGLRRAGRTSAR